MNQPKVTVLMPVYNAVPYLSAAIQSILDQTFTDFELLIINNGSTDASDDVIKIFADDRIRYIRRPHNSGLIATLNEGLDSIESEYIVRMDADDLSHPDRIAKQVAFMDANPEIAISGTWFEMIDLQDKVTHPIKPAACKVKLLEGTVLGHPTVIMRRKAIERFNLRYNPQALFVEDYQFWADASQYGLALANIPEILLHYRVHNNQVSAQKKMEQEDNATLVRLNYAQYFFGGFIADQKELYFDLVHYRIRSYADLIKAKKLIGELKQDNALNLYFEPAVFDAHLNHLLKQAAIRVYVLCIDCGVEILIKSLNERLFYTTTSTYQKVKFVLRSLQKSLF